MAPPGYSGMAVQYPARHGDATRHGQLRQSVEHAELSGPNAQCALPPGGLSGTACAAVPLVEFVAELFDVDFSGHVTLEEFIMTVTERCLRARRAAAAAQHAASSHRRHPLTACTD